MQTDVTDKVATCTAQLDIFREPANAELVEAIRGQTGTEAVSIFLAEPNHPATVRYAAGTGYRNGYQNTKYSRPEANQKLTAYVYTYADPITASLQELEAESSKYPYSGRCTLYLDSELRNIIAVPIVCHETRCVGVLKLENKIDKDRTERFPSEDYTLARVLAQTLAQHYDFWVCNELNQSLARIQLELHRTGDLPSYLTAACRSIVRGLRAECASFFLAEPPGDDPEDQILRCVAGVGYKDEYIGTTYEPNEPQGERSFTRYVYEHEDGPVFRTESELLANHKTIPFRGACVSKISSGSFRNILTMPLTNPHSGSKIGLLKIENKLPEDANFDELDAIVCEHAVATNILYSVLTAPSLGADPRALVSRGREMLEKQLAQIRDFKMMTQEQRTRILKEIRDEFREVTVDQCAEAEGVSRSTLNRRFHILRREHSIES